MLIINSIGLKGAAAVPREGLIRFHTAGSKTHSLDFATTHNMIISAVDEALGGSSATSLCQFESSALLVRKVCESSQILSAKGKFVLISGYLK